MEGSTSNPVQFMNSLQHFIQNPADKIYSHISSQQSNSTVSQARLYLSQQQGASVGGEVSVDIVRFVSKLSGEGMKSGSLVSGNNLKRADSSAVSNTSKFLKSATAKRVPSSVMGKSQTGEPEKRTAFSQALSKSSTSSVRKVAILSNANQSKEKAPQGPPPRCPGTRNYQRNVFPLLKTAEVDSAPINVFVKLMQRAGKPLGGKSRNLKGMFTPSFTLPPTVAVDTTRVQSSSPPTNTPGRVTTPHNPATKPQNIVYQEIPLNSPLIPTDQNFPLSTDDQLCYFIPPYEFDVNKVIYTIHPTYYRMQPVFWIVMHKKSLVPILRPTILGLSNTVLQSQRVGETLGTLNAYDERMKQSIITMKLIVDLTLLRSLASNIAETLSQAANKSIVVNMDTCKNSIFSVARNIVYFLTDILEGKRPLPRSYEEAQAEYLVQRNDAHKQNRNLHLYTLPIDPVCAWWGAHEYEVQHRHQRLVEAENALYMAIQRANVAPNLATFANKLHNDYETTRMQLIRTFGRENK